MTIHSVDELKADAQRLATSVDTDKWELGKVLGRLYEKLPRTEFHEWCDNELSFTPRHCRDLIRVSAEFTKDDVRRFCETKLRLVLQQRDPRLKEKAMALLRAGASRRRMEEELGREPRKLTYDEVYRRALALPTFELRRLYKELRERFENARSRRRAAKAA